MRAREGVGWGRVCVCVWGGGGGYWGLTPQQQPGSYQGGEMMMMMKSVFWWRKPEYPEETTDLGYTDDTHTTTPHHTAPHHTQLNTSIGLYRGEIIHSWLTLFNNNSSAKYEAN